MSSHNLIFLSSYLWLRAIKLRIVLIKTHLDRCVWNICVVCYGEAAQPLSTFYLLHSLILLKQIMPDDFKANLGWEDKCKILLLEKPCAIYKMYASDAWTASQAEEKFWISCGHLAGKSEKWWMINPPGWSRFLIPSNPRLIWGHPPCLTFVLSRRHVCIIEHVELRAGAVN